MSDDTKGSVKFNEAATFYVPPPPAGSYMLGEHMFFNLPKKPNWFHRKMTQLLLGWKWIDN